MVRWQAVVIWSGLLIFAALVWAAAFFGLAKAVSDDHAQGNH